MRLIGFSAALFAASLGGCGRSSSAEASTSLDAEQLPALLKALQPLFERGFGNAEAAQIHGAFPSMEVGEYKVFEFAIAHRGADDRLRVEMKKDDPSTVDIWFFAGPELATEIQKTMRSAIREAVAPEFLAPRPKRAEPDR